MTQDQCRSSTQWTLRRQRRRTRTRRLYRNTNNLSRIVPLRKRTIAVPSVHPDQPMLHSFHVAITLVVWNAVRDVQNVLSADVCRLRLLKFTSEPERQ